MSYAIGKTPRKPKPSQDIKLPETPKPSPVDPGTVAESTGMTTTTKVGLQLGGLGLVGIVTIGVAWYYIWKM